MGTLNTQCIIIQLQPISFKNKHPLHFTGRRRTYRTWKMLFYTKKAVTVAVVILMTIALCSTNIQEVRTQFVKNKFLSTIYATRQSISQLQCVQWCSTERKSGKCKIAGYNKYSKACSLSMDYQHNLLDVADETTGVFLMEEGKIFYEK